MDWTPEMILLFLQEVNKKFPQGMKATVTDPESELFGQEVTVLGTMHFTQLTAAKMAVDAGDGTEYVMSVFLKPNVE